MGLAAKVLFDLVCNRPHIFGLLTNKLGLMTGNNFWGPHVIDGLNPLFILIHAVVSTDSVVILFTESFERTPNAV